MKRCPYEIRNITTDADGRRHYWFPDGRYAITGTDVSHYVGNVDWDLVREDGISFAMIRAGGRKLATGELYTDIHCHENFDNAVAAGIPVGAYFCSSAVNEEEMLEEADYLAGLLKGHDIRWPVVLDIEVPKEGWRTFALTPDIRTDTALVFKSRIESAGYHPMLYCNSIPGMQTLMDVSRLEEMDKWIAEYRFKPFYPYDFSIWQYSCTASIKGISGEGDLDLSFVDYGA